MTERNTRIRANQIIDITPLDLQATNSPSDNQVATYDSVTGEFTWADQTGGEGSGSSYTVSFTNANLTAGKITITHNLNITYPIVLLYDENDAVVEPDEINYKTLDTIELDLTSFGTISGTWNVRVGTGGGGGASNLSELTDIDFASGTPTDNQILQYNSSSGKWEAQSFTTVESHLIAYNHSNIHEQNKDTYLAYGTVDQSTAGDVKDAVTKKHTVNLDTYLDYGQANQVSASEIHTALVTTIPGKASKISGGTENNFISIDSAGNIKDSGKKDSDYATSGHNHDSAYINRANTGSYTPTADYHPATKKYVDDLVSGVGLGDMLRTVYDTDVNGIVDNAEALDDGQSGSPNRVTASEAKDAYTKRHEHSNKSTLDTYNQSNTDLTDAVSKKHSHSNQSTLDSYTQSNTDLADAVSKKHSHSSSLSDIDDAVSKRHSQNTDTGTNQNSFNLGDGLDTTKTLYANNGDGNKPALRYNHSTNTWQLSNDGTTFADIEAGTGSGDMLKSTYDSDDNGIVDFAEAVDDGTSGQIYRSTAVEIRDAVDKKHSHSNKSTLDTYNQSNTDISDAVSKKHSQNTDTGTNQNSFNIGDGLDTNKTLYASNGDANKPALRYNASSNKWEYSNNGTDFSEMGSGGGTLTVKEADGTPSISNVTQIQFDQATGFVVTDLGSGAVKVALGSHWKDLVVSGQTTLTPTGEETLEFVAGAGITITTSSGTTPKKITITAGGSSTSYRTSFTNASLSAGILTVTHSLSQKFVIVAIYNNSDKQIIPDDIALDSTSQLSVDLTSYGTLTGTWNIVVLA